MKRLASLIALVLLGVAVPTPAQMTPQQAREEGKSLGNAMRSDEAWVPKNNAQAMMVPGYQGTDLLEADYFSNPDKLANDAHALKGTSEAYQISTDANKSRPTFPGDEIKAVTTNASAIENDPSTQLGGESITGGSGECKPLPAEESQIYYDATCDTGVVVNSVPSETVYSCPTGWTLGGATCSTVETVPASIRYSCEAGWTLSGAQCAQTQPANVSAYSCPAGWTLNGSRCSRTLSENANQTGYNCPNGYSLAGSHCQRTVTTAATPSYSCPSGYSLSGTSCVRNFSYAATATYSCPAGWSLSGTACNRMVSQPATISYSCPAGQTVSGSQCSSTASYQATATPYCPVGTYIGSFCQSVVTVSKISTPDCSHLLPKQGIVWLDSGTYWCAVLIYKNFSCEKSINGYKLQRDLVKSTENLRQCLYTVLTAYKCPEGTSDNGAGTCNQVTQTQPSVGYSCPSGGTLNGTSCTYNQISGAIANYSCPAGYQLAGNSCLLQQSQVAEISYSCPQGGALSGSTCNRNEQIPATMSYSCPTGYVLGGASCSRTDTVQASPVYACPTGYSLSGTTCTRTEDQAATPIYVCPTGFVLSGSQCTATVAAQPVYYCPADFTLSGQTCSRTHSQPAASHQQCPKAANSNPDGSCSAQDPQNDCGALQGNPQCSWKYDNCLDETPSADGCKMMEKVYRCPVPGGTVQQPPKYVCGDDVYCINGDCETINREASSEFKDALTALHAIDTAGKDFDPDNMHVFPGTRDTCHKPIFGVVNCCAGKVSGLLPLGIGGAALAGAISGNVAALAGVATQFLTTFLCSTDEKMLDVKDRMGFCTFVGSYCSSSVLGVCKTKRKTYCCFESKLSRILQEQGRPQINKPFGKPKSEQCEGFTVEEFSRLDLSVMDFTDVYSDFMDAARMPDEIETMNDIQQKIQDYYELHSQ
jgi:conjugal transfer mating pair stabilization protein TraN